VTKGKTSKQWFRYGFFVQLENGQLLPGVNEFGVTRDAYKKGDSKHVHSGKEGTVLEVVKGPFARKMGFDVLVLIDEKKVI
jgi:hypothetical protein